MRKLFFTSLLTIALAMGCFGASAEDEVIALDKAWAKAVVANDIAAIEGIIDPGLIYSHSDGQVDTKEVYVNRLKKGTSVYQAIDISKIAAKLFGDTAVVNVRATFRVMADGKQINNDLAYTHVYKKNGGKWRMISHQSARLAQ